jgi:hypothetical protein
MVEKRSDSRWTKVLYIQMYDLTVAMLGRKLEEQFEGIPIRHDCVGAEISLPSKVVLEETSQQRG